MNRTLKIALVVMGLITGVLLIAAGLLFIQGPLKSYLIDRPQLQVYVQAPPMATLGEQVRMVLIVENPSNEYLPLDEIRFPALLTDAAVIMDVFPSLKSGNQKFYGDQTGYPIGLILEPGERREININLMPWQIADVTSVLEVVSGETIIPIGFRMVYDKPVVVVQPSDTPTPIPPTETPTLTPTIVPTETPVPIPYGAVVKLIAKMKYSSRLRNLWGGSGTIVTSDGLILTNAHLVRPDARTEADAYVIAITVDPVEPPVEMYFAEPVLVDKELDLAILKITTDLKYKEVDWTKVKLPTVRLGDSDSLQLGDMLTILGYPGIGGDTITLTTGNVGGFTAQKSYGDRAYIKTSAMISGGTSGGSVLDSTGSMVAIPTQLGYGGEEDVVDCRVITDTNGDGRIDQRDMCIPVGGFINALRPINLAISLIESAKQMTGRGK